MDSFSNTFQAKFDELLKNLSVFTEKQNNSAGTRVRKNAQDMKKLLQDLRLSVLEEQKSRKANKPPKEAKPPKAGKKQKVEGSEETG